MLRRGKVVQADLGDERGAAMAEYLPIAAVIAVLVMVAAAFIGPWVAEQLIDPSVALDKNACPPGWNLTDAGFQPGKKNGKEDKNGDSFVCVKEIPGSGNGNNGAGSNIKDNNRYTP
ncbi:MAG: hypothetical protein BMS9Abin07_2112 [Acidimicrobiia bacterium]|nr:MAG: hypothetical protein BMS9Abin07_2112 [Acidimicrobiia bacterium]